MPEDTLFPFLRTPYNYNTNQAGDESGLDCKDESRTKQSFKDETDINILVERFKVTGEIPTGQRIPIQGDLGHGLAFRAAMDLIVRARQSFEQLPAKIRAQFDHDPAAFVEFAALPENRQDLRKWGMLSAEAMAADDAAAASALESTIQQRIQATQSSPETTLTLPKGKKAEPTK